MRLFAMCMALVLSAPVKADKVLGDVKAASSGLELIESGALLIDVRSEEEFKSGHLEGSVNIPHTDLDALKAAIGSEKDRSVVLYCRSGNRAGRVLDALAKLGYTEIYNATGYTALVAAQQSE